MSTRIPVEKKAVHDEIAAALADFGANHLDPELTGYVLDLWARVCRTSKLDPRRGHRGVWAAAVTHVVARMNFCYDRAQPVYLKLDTICNFFNAAKNTVGGKASQIEKTLRLGSVEPGLCRRELLDSFTMIRLSNGMVMTLAMAKMEGLVPPDA